jgi:hypothetical protein
MFKNIDDKGLEGFCYYNKDDIEEFVSIRSQCGGLIIDIIANNNETVAIYREDIPKLIKALQAAKEYMDKEYI